MKTQIRMRMVMAVLTLALLAGGEAGAANIWDGGGADDNWVTAANWDNDAVPSFPRPLTFAGMVRLTPNNEAAGRTVSNLIFAADAGPFTIAGNAFTLAGNITNNSTAAQTVNNAITLGATRTVTANANGADIVLGGAIGDSGSGYGLTKAGAGTLTLNGDNTFSGTVTLNGAGGRLIMGHANALGLGTGAIALTAGTLDPGDAPRTNANPLTLTAHTIAGTNNLTLNGTLTALTGASRTLTSSLDAGKTLTLTNVVVANAAAATFTLQGTGDTTINGVISESGAAGAKALSLRNRGTTKINKANTHTGATSLSGGGTVILNYDAADGGVDGDHLPNAVLNLASGMIGGCDLILKGGTHPEEVLSTTWGLGTHAGHFNVIRQGGTATLRMNVITYATTVRASVDFSVDSLASTDTANNNGILLRVANDPALATVGGTNWARGSTDGADADDPIVALTAYSAFPAANAHNLLTGGANLGATVAPYTLKIVSNGDDQQLNLQTYNINGNPFCGLMYAGGGNNKYSIIGSGQLFSGGAGRSIVVATNAELTIATPISAATTATVLIKYGKGRAILSAASLFTGDIKVNEGALRLKNATASGTTAGGIMVAASAYGSALELDKDSDGNPISIGAEALTMNGNGISNGGALRNISGNNSYAGLITIEHQGARINSDADTLTLSGGITTAAGNDVTFGGAGNITVSTVAISGAGGVTKDGAGTLELTAANTYTGPTTVNAGTMKVTLSLDATAVRVNAGGTLTGGGSCSNVFLAAGGRLVATNTTLTVSNLVLSANSTNYFDGGRTGVVVTAAGTVNDTLGLTIHPGAKVVLTGVSANTTNNLIQYSGTIKGNVTNLSVASSPVSGQHTFITNNGYVAVVVPSSGSAPMIEQSNPVVVSMNEDSGTTNLALGQILTAYDADSASNQVTWSLVGGSGPANGTAVVNGTGTNPVGWTTFTYTPNINFYGTNQFTVMAQDEGGRSSVITVRVDVAAVNDAPVKMTDPVLQSPGSAWLFSDVWTHTSGTWQDNADTNANYTDATFQGAKTFLYQWQWSNSATMGDINLATNAALTPNDFGGYVGTNLRVAVWRVDDRWPSGTSATSAPAYTGWQTVQGVLILAPVITNAGPLATTVLEDAAATDLQAVFSLLATNIAEAGTLTWGVAVAPTQGTVVVSGGTTVSSVPTNFTYQPAANLNGGDSFVVCVSNGVGLLSSNITVNIDITAVNDPPTNTVAPGFSGTRLQYNTLTATNGVWNDNADTNATYTHAVFTNTAAFTRQWQRTDSTNEPVAVTNLLDQTNATYTLTHDDKYKWFRVAVTCMDSSNGTPVNASNTAYSSWLKETSTVPTVVVFTNALNDGAWGSYSNWTPDEVPSPTINAVIGDTAVLSPASVTLATGTEAAKNLYLGTNSSSKGTLTMTGGTLTFPAAGNITVAGANSSTGTLNQTGGTVAGITSGTLTMGSGSNSVGAVTLGNDSSITSAVVIASQTGASGTLTLTNSARWRNTAANRNIGSAANASGALNVYGSGSADLASRNLTLGSVANSTGMLTVADSGVVENIFIFTIGDPGRGDVTVRDSGRVYTAWTDLNSTGGVSCALTVTNSGLFTNLRNIGGGADGMATVTLCGNATGTAYNSYSAVGAVDRSTGRLYVRNNAVFDGSGRPMFVGGGNASAGANTCTGIVEVSDFGMITNVYTLTIGDAGYGEMTVRDSGKVYSTGGYFLNLSPTGGVSSVLTVTNSGHVRYLRYIGGGEDGMATVTLSGNATGVQHAGAGSIGYNARSSGRLYVRDNAVYEGSGQLLTIAEGTNSAGLVELSGSGVLTNCTTLNVGYGDGSAGRLDLLGGKLYVSSALKVGTLAGSTGRVTVANCVQTNIAGAVTVGGGTGDRYGSIMISNATFGGGTRVMVLTNGFVEFTGTGSVFTCNSFTNNGGVVTNHVQQFAGGIDITNSAVNALAVTNGGKVHLSFEGNSDALPSGNFWGLRWAGTNGYPVLTDFVASGAITVTNVMSGVFSNQTMTVYKAGDNSYTYLGFINATAPVINGGATGIETNANEDGIVYLTNLLWAADVDGSSWAWTNVTGSGPANGAVAVNGSGTNPVNWSVFTYTPNANFNGTNSFQVRVMDDTLLSDSLTVTVVVAAGNDAPTNTTAPGIRGSGQYGTTWTATNGVWNDNLDTNATYTHAMFTNTAGFAYQWQYSNDVVIAGATSATFVPSEAMGGTNIRVRVTCTDGGEGGAPAGLSVVAYSAYLTVVAPTNDPPANTTLPGITGNSAYGSVWTATNGVWNDNSDTNVHYTHDNFTNTAKFTYQWQYSNAAPDNILNETNAAFMTAAPMLGTNIRVMVTCTDAGYGVPASTSTVAYSAYKLVTAPSLLVFNKTSDIWANSANWTPNVVPSAGTPAVIGDTNVMSPAEAQIGDSDTAEVKDLYLGTNTSSKGTLTMTGGTLTGNGSLTLGNVASSTGTINQTGGTVANYTSTYLGENGNGSWNMSGSAMATNLSGNFYVGNNAGSVGKLLLQDSAVWSNVFPVTYLRVGSTQTGTSGGDGTVEVNGGTFWIMRTGASGHLQLGGAGGIGRLVLTGGSATVGGSLGLSLGHYAGGTGVLSVAGGTYNGAITIGDAGQGYVYATNNGTLSAAAVTMGFGAGSNAYMLVDGNATVTANKLTLGNAAGNVSTLDLNSGTTTVSAAGANTLSVGFAAGSTGLVTVAGGSHTWSSDSVRPIGDGAGTFGRVRITGGSLSASGGTSVGNQGSGELLIEGGAFTNSSTLDLGYASGGFGRVQVTGGQWVQTGALRVPSTAGGTGIVTVANCVSTNITGAMTVGGGTTGGDRYGSVTISNATFGGGTVVSVLTNGFVELTGAGSVLRCNTFTCRGGVVTNHIRQFAGGVDVTNSANTALVITNGGTMFLSFDQGPVAEGDFWGLRWAGNGKAGLLQGMTNSGALSWDDSAAGGSVKIYTNATHTMVGYVPLTSGTTFRFR